MPWKVFGSDNKFCIHKLNADDSKGDLVACHDTELEAAQQMRALYASEKEVSGPSSFVELRRAREMAQAVETQAEVKQDFLLLAENVFERYDDIEEAGLAIVELASEFRRMTRRSKGETGFVGRAKRFLRGIANKSKGDQEDNMLLFKDKDDRLRFVVRYSNNFRDDDYPVKEIISEDSHRRFVEKVDKGISPMPELWLWHVPEWKIGQADWLAYDDSGFAMASGLIDQGMEDLAVNISKQKGVRTSHGMPPATIVRDPEDPTTIVEHESVEISILPELNAANKMTGYYILGNESKEAEMAVPAKKRDELAEKWGVSPEVLDKLEATNSRQAKEAEELGIERKEAGTAQPETPEPGEKTEKVEAEAEKAEVEAAVEPVQEDAPPADENTDDVEDAEVANKATGDSPTRDEIAEAVVQAVIPLQEENRKLAESVAQLRKEVSHLQDSDERKIEKAISDTPPASLSALVASRLSVLNSKETEIDGRSTLAKSRPAEATPEVTQRTGIGFLDKMLSGVDEEAAQGVRRDG